MTWATVLAWPAWWSWWAGQAAVFATARNLPFYNRAVVSRCSHNRAQLAFLLLKFVNFGHHVLGGHFAHAQFIIDAIVQMLDVVVDSRQCDAY